MDSAYFSGRWTLVDLVDGVDMAYACPGFCSCPLCPRSPLQSTKVHRPLWSKSLSTVHFWLFINRFPCYQKVAHRVYFISTLGHNFMKNDDATHTWPLYVAYHSCPQCGKIIESRDDFAEKDDCKSKNLQCPRCAHTYTVIKPGRSTRGPLFGKATKPEFQWENQ